MTDHEDIIERLTQFVEPIVVEEGCELIAVEIAHENKKRILRLFIDKSGGVSVADCARVSHAVEDVLQVEDILSGAYDLEVSSPGLDRPLKKLSHFVSVMGKTIQVTTKEKINGRGRYKGVLKEVSQEQVIVSVDGKDHVIPFVLVEKANLVYEF